MERDDYTDGPAEAGRYVRELEPDTTSRELRLDPPQEPKLPSAVHRPDDLAARRLVQRRRRVRAAARSDRIGDRGRLDDDRPVPAGRHLRPDGGRRRRPG